MLWVSVASAALALECPATMAVQGSTPAPPANLALGVSRAIQPESVIRSFSGHAAVDSLSRYLATDSQVAELEKSLPGFRASMTERAPAAIDHLLDTQIPLLHNCMAEKIAHELPVSDLRATLKFATSPAGKKILQQITDNSIRTYLKKGPLTKDDVERIKAMPVAPNAAIPSAAGRVAKALVPVFEKWSAFEFEAENKLMGEIAEDVAADMAASSRPS